MPEVALTIKGKNLSQQAIAQLKADIEKTTKALHEQAGANVEVADSTKKTASSYTGLTIALGAASAALGLLTRSIVKSAMEQERMFKSLTAVEDGAKNAEKAMVRLREVAKLPGLSLAQAVQGYTNLRAIDMNAQLAERSLKAFGNALVTVGKGAPQLQLVILALTQMSAKGKVLGQDLRQLQEQLPQIRKVMKQAFGTADVEAVQKKLEETGQTADDFIRTIVTGFEKLPKVMGGAANAVENFNDQWFQTKVQLGEALLPILTQVLDKLGDLMDVFNKLPKPIKDTIGMGIAGGAGLAGLGFALMGISKLILPLIADIKGLSATMLTANTSTGIWASGLTVAAAKLGIIALAAIEVAWAINRIKEAAEKPINIPQIMSDADKENLDRLNKMREVVAKQMTRAEYKPGDMVSGETRYALSGGNPLWDALKRINKSTNPKAQYIETAFGNIDPLMKTEDLLARIDSQIEKIKNKTMGRSGLGSAWEVTESTRKGMLDLEDIQKQFDEITSLGEKGFAWTREEKLGWWSSLVEGQFVPSITDKAKVGVHQMVDQYRKEILADLKKGQKFSAADFISPKEKTTPMPGLTLRPGPFADQTFPFANQVSADAMFPEERIKAYAQMLDVVMQATKYLATQDALLAIEKKKLAQAFDDSMFAMMKANEEAELIRQQKIRERGEVLIEGMGQKEIEAALKFRNDLEQKSLDESLRMAQEYRDKQMVMWEDLAYSISDVFAQIPRDLINNLDSLENVFKSFGKGILNVVLNLAGDAIGDTVYGGLKDIFSNMINPASQSTGGFGALGSIGMALATGNPMALVGALPSVLEGISFDDPYNDAMAYKSGGRSAIAMTRKSSMDFINNFEAGFAKKTQQQTGEGGLSDKLDKLIGLMQDQKYEFYMDGDQITTKVRKRINKKENRGEWANG